MNRQKVTTFVKQTLKINTLIRKKYYRVRDHSHFSGKYRSTAHKNSCGLMDQTKIIILSKKGQQKSLKDGSLSKRKY